MKVNPGSYFIIPAGNTSTDAVFGIEDIDNVNQSLGINPVIKLNLERMDYDPRLGG